VSIVPRLLGTDRDLDALPSQVVDGALEIGRVDLEAEVETAGEPPVYHHPRLRRAEVLRPDAREVQPALTCRISIGCMGPSW
jgi:hypothetical protein